MTNYSSHQSASLNSSALQNHYQRADRFMLYICYGLTVYALGLAFWYDTWMEALIIGVGGAVALTAIYAMAKATAVCRAAMACGLMVYTALHIHQAHGMIEMHFGVFALLAMLLYYRDWVPILVAAGVIAVHHFAFFYLQAGGASVWVLDSADRSVMIIVLHAAYVIVETGLLLWFAAGLKHEAIQAQEIMTTTSNITDRDYIDLTQRTSGSSDLLRRFDRYTAEVEALAKQVHQGADQLHAEGSVLVGITDKMRHASSTQQRETDMIAAAIEQMTAAIREVSSHAEVAANASEQVDRSAREAAGVSHTTRDAVRQLADLVAKAAQTINALNQQADGIGSVLGVIRGVAEQTNLLALNAAIEAARAGDQGRGFAVVADEVRTLAQRTQQSTEEIDQMIEQLQAGSHSAVDIIDHSRASAEACMESTNNALTLMEQVSRAIEEINRMNTMIATAATEQSSVVNEVSENLANIVNASKQATADAGQAATSSAALHQIAEQLNQQTRRFRLSE